MGEFFKGWRRKTGLVTLAMAVLSMGLWFRSQSITDYVTTGGFRKEYLTVTMGGGQLVCSQVKLRGHDLIIPGKAAKLSWSSMPYRSSHLELSADYEYSTRRRLLNAEFSIATANHGSDEYELSRTVASWKLPILWFVLPLTLLSAWLILGKRPKRRAVDSSPAQN